MNTDQIWQAVDAHRAGLCDLLAGLGDDEWRRSSLCADWTVREVAAHLTLQQLGPGAVLGQMLKWRGSVDRTVAHVARLRASALTTEQLIAEIRATIGSRRHIFGGTYLEILCDILVHSQDIAIPLGRRLDVPADAAAVAADRVLSMRWPPPLPSVKKMAGLRLTATDISWTAGDGPAVQGPMAALLLVCCGRTAALSQLTGDGVGELTARLAPGTAAGRP
ncbi:maleylpyruvate isomerase family mycothiol-dependent enzyme [Actinoplanes sp. KI2]|uniref:maleylpyruvate isomerase family mycothiol-dependent enzyme n=1 Tax=Actinoplanes sp. KI2 TaxID=2983315 RepID=UPI0021D5A13C|nr:maleylpyruvate isomerase family mycothiol-dependent enzyme [Actinoplanes sp. KI2]MCU7729359.1 maleylpyruvate isomerase family mycothiol-dependent enzyme [Actinoplanes sp. KI2]